MKANPTHKRLLKKVVTCYALGARMRGLMLTSKLPHANRKRLRKLAKSFYDKLSEEKS